MDSSGVQGLQGSWDYVDSENFDEYLKDLGVSWTHRMIAKGVKPHLTISELDGKWTVLSESALKTRTYDFIPGVEFDETTSDGREAKSIINFEGNKWIHTAIDKNGKKTVVTRYVDAKGQQITNLECGSVKARRWYKRAE
ncbi:unnamed protein product [Rotaria sordida]|uniref:Lipocalin/cytosolic fatty-acid binding domain-containing protein n=1 Tax=Rotaria sordida TaxID=392033 RepID=A0A815PLN8_9BILA|nr:unnamed protein product [Rotaria sordida]CAF1450491.1 unnamed protein product [Rotaria sordida]CAF3823880.1 unnamed protein product [Rotaria sordida]CAF3969531.1 unnamed protein product [Rotaria sordida]